MDSGFAGKRPRPGMTEGYYAVGWRSTGWRSR
jgi:hypothetical protein